MFPPPITIDQESTSPSCEFGGFEGPEKLLEIWFAPSPQHLPSHSLNDDNEKLGLRVISQAVWTPMLDMVHCEVLNSVHNEYVDAYLLSESSFFVYPHKLILKTCGTTTLLVAVPKLLELAKSVFGDSLNIHHVFYSRKSFMFPEKQLYPHGEWKDEVAYLDSFFDNGASYSIGRTNGDHWFLYQTSDQIVALPSPPHSIESSHSMSDYLPDFTIEILMTGLSPDHCKSHFYEAPGKVAGIKGGAEVSQAIGLAKIYPASTTDSFLFSPCGFSLNGILDSHYFNVHVTPEPHCSYASFESNVPLGAHGSESDVNLLIQSVINCFQPQSVTVTLFQEGTDYIPSPQLEQYKRTDSMVYELEDYRLRYAHFKASN